MFDGLGLDLILSLDTADGGVGTKLVSPLLLVLALSLCLRFLLPLTRGLLVGLTPVAGVLAPDDPVAWK